MTDDQVKEVKAAVYTLKTAKKHRAKCWDAKNKAADEYSNSETELVIAETRLSALMNELSEPVVL